MDTEGGEFQPVSFEVWSQEVASAPRELLEMQIWGLNPRLGELASLGWRPGSCVLADSAGVACSSLRSTVGSFSEFSQVLLMGDWGSGALEEGPALSWEVSILGGGWRGLLSAELPWRLAV